MLILRFDAAPARYSLYLGVVPFLVAEGANTTSLEPALDAVEVEDLRSGVGGVTSCGTNAVWNYTLKMQRQRDMIEANEVHEGRKFASQVAVPPGVSPGMQFQVQVPMMPVAVAQAVPMY